MSAHSHDQPGALKPQETGRPPGIKTRPCTALYSTGRQCGNYAASWVPEMPVCASHLPVEWISVNNSRIQQWMAEGALLWDLIIEANPVEMKR